MDLKEKEFNEKKLNEIHSSMEEKGKTKINFYTFKDILIYENKYKLNTTIREVINDFYSKVPEQMLFDKLNKGKYFNKNEIMFFLKEEIYEKLIKTYKQLVSEEESLDSSNNNVNCINYSQNSDKINK